MNFITLAKSRYSVRAYQSRQVEDSKILDILTAAHVAPSAANLQPIKILVVQSEEGLRKLSFAANLYGAPLAFIICADTDRAWRRPFDNKSTADIDASIVCDHIMLAASDAGLGTVWETYFEMDIVIREFGLPRNLEPINILVAGYAADEPQSPNRHVKTRKPLEELAEWC